MKKILIGDHSWTLTAEGGPQKSPAQIILDGGTALAHSYNKVLLKNPGLVRTPTALCNKSVLLPGDLQDRIEAIHTIAVAIGKEAISNSKSDTLLAGTVGPYIGAEDSTRVEEYERIFGEPAVYMVDGGVDVLLLEGFTCFHQFQIAVRTMRRLNSVPLPLAAFFKMNSFDKKLYQEVLHFADQMELELIGFELSVETIESLPKNLTSGESALGFQIGWDNNITHDKSRLEKVLDKLKAYDPTMLLGGAGTEAKVWSEFTALLST